MGRKVSKAMKVGGPPGGQQLAWSRAWLAGPRSMCPSASSGAHAPCSSRCQATQSTRRDPRPVALLSVQALGASEVTPRGEGDDDRDIDADFDQWSGQLFAALDSGDLVTASKVRGAGPASGEGRAPPLLLARLCRGVASGTAAPAGGSLACRPVHRLSAVHLCSSGSIAGLRPGPPCTC